MPPRSRPEPSTACLNCIATRFAGAHLVANPGCYATSVILALSPLVAAGIVDLATASWPTQKAASAARAKRPPQKRTSCMRPTISPPTASLPIATPANCSSRLARRKRRSSSRRTCCRFRAEFSPRSTCVQAAQTAESIARIYRDFFTDSPMVRLYRQDAAADSVFGAHQLLPTSVSNLLRRPTMRHRQLSRQPAEGRCRTGRAKSERNARLAKRKARMNAAEGLE